MVNLTSVSSVTPWLIYVKNARITFVEGACHILVIEDDPVVARSLGEGLERGAFRVTWKASGEVGVQFAIRR